MSLVIEEHTQLAPHTTLEVGGPARYLARCRSIDEVREALSWGRGNQLPVQVLGGGSNTIFADRGYCGLVLKMETRGIEVSDVAARPGATTAEVRAAAGEDWDGLVAECIGRDLGGLECLSGIPGLVGATPIQNVGAYGQDVGQTIASVRALERDSLVEVELASGECEFDYRHSRFKGRDRDRYVITEVTFQLPVAAPPPIRYAELQRNLDQVPGLGDLHPGRELSTAVREAVLSLRRAKSMVVDPDDADSRSVGSFFLNPVLTADVYGQLERRWAREGDGTPLPSFEDPAGHKVPAAWLVERAGYERGTRRGGAGISSHHALALIQCGGGADDILDLAEAIQRSVAERFGIALEREPEIVAYEPEGQSGQGGD